MANRDPDFINPVSPAFSEAAVQISSLAAKINDANVAYYVSNDPLYDDDVYDAMCRELNALLAANPTLQLINNPLTQVAGGLGSGDVRHLFPMLSIENALGRAIETSTGEEIDFSTLEKWIAQRGKVRSWLVDFKYDGLALSMVFDSRGLYSAAVRGDGSTGEDVSGNVVKSNIAKGIKGFANTYSEVRGEVVVLKDDLLEINQIRVDNNEKPFASPRHAAAGILRSRKDTNDLLLSYLHFMPYEVITGPTAETATREFCGSGISFSLDGGESEVYPTYIKHLSEISTYNQGDVMSVVKRMAAVRDSLPYVIDGLVIKILDADAPARFGSTQKYPNWMIAFKFPPAKATSVLLGVRLQVGRTGVVTPVADIAPVVLGGTVVESPTLNNFAWIHERKLEVGAEIVVERAGDVIPAIVGRLDKAVEHYTPMTVPTVCPCCQSTLVSIDNHRHLLCVNHGGCSAQIENAIIHFGSRKCMDIKGLGPVMVRDLIEAGVVKESSDLYHLSISDIENAASLPKGSSLAKSLFDNIEASLHIKPARLLAAMGVAEIGSSTAEELIEHFGSIARVWAATTEELVGVTGIAKTKALTISSSMLAMQSGYERLMMLPWVFKGDKEPDVEQTHTGEHWVITGSFPEKRTEIEQHLKARGAKVSGSVSSNTTHLLVGVKPTQHKVVKATDLKVTIVNWEQFKI